MTSLRAPAPSAWCRLGFDSDLFGFEVGRIEAPELSDAELDRVVAEMQAAGVQLAYWLVDPARVSEASRWSALGGRVVAHRRAYVRHLPTSPPQPRGVAIVRFAAELPDEALLGLALQSGESSRFAVDPCVGRGNFEALYGAWVTNCTRDPHSDGVFVIRGDGGLCRAMVTVDRVASRGRIGLIAVDPASRRQGWGRALVEHSWRHALDAGLDEVEVVTQRANHGACRLYEACGYRLEREQAWVHFCWREMAGL